MSKLSPFRQIISLREESLADIFPSHYPVSALGMKKRPLISFVFCLLTVFFLPVSVFATTIFGPQDFAAGWFGVHYSSHFFNADPAAKGQLHVTKSAVTTYRTGFLSINGKIVNLHSFLRGGEMVFANEINLKKNNTIQIFFVTKKGGSLSVRIDQGPAAPPPEIVFNAGPSDILLGESSTLTWSTKDADSVSIAPGIGDVNPSGSVSVTPASTTEYILTATGPGGSAEARTTVSVTVPPPTVTLHATPVTIAPGESSRLSWNTTNADTCTIAPDVGRYRLQRFNQYDAKHNHRLYHHSLRSRRNGHCRC
jgi:hypothetical protein